MCKCPVAIERDKRQKRKKKKRGELEVGGKKEGSQKRSVAMCQPS